MSLSGFLDSLFGDEAPSGGREPARLRTVAWRDAQGAPHKLEYALYVKRGVRRYKLTVREGRAVEVTAPRSGSGAAADRLVLENLGWIARQMSAWSRDRAALGLPPFAPRDGGTVLYRGETAHIRLGFRSHAAVRGEDGGWELRLALAAGASPDEVCAALAVLLKKEAKRVIAESYARMAPRARRLPLSWQLSGARMRWGVCTAKGTVRWAWRLIFVPDELIDYVVAHELSHLIEFNHSKAFWHEVSLIDPAWQEHRKALRRYRADALPDIR